jgi:hypothetical protein
MDLNFRVRELDNVGVSDECTLETKNLEEAISLTRNLLCDPNKKWVIIATLDKENQEE